MNNNIGLTAAGIRHRSKINGGMLKTDRCTPRDLSAAVTDRKAVINRRFVYSAGQTD
ncbi:hypothetical protein JI735_26615 [Paenibacillus sonchi]|uniref:Uncharacterized protein n=1 Tax=Paenibacillus sonchi TaxID=373687 RepID=A0A974PA09_9BACL|nr:hypothetical protein [Paenibacillus sonchi]QQZ60089.1 hypothetical protein JI735_26615 [Paenibacillus sonchi]